MPRVSRVSPLHWGLPQDRAWMRSSQSLGPVNPQSDQSDFAHGKGVCTASLCWPEAARNLHREVLNLQSMSPRNRLEPSRTLLEKCSKAPQSLFTEDSAANSHGMCWALHVNPRDGGQFSAALSLCVIHPRGSFKFLREIRPR